MKRDDLLDLNDALQHPGKVISVDLSTELPEEEDLDMVRPLEGALDVVSTGSMLLVTGDFSTRVVIECSRCGEPFEAELSFAMEEEFPVEGTPSSFASDDYARMAPNDEPYPLFQGNHLMVEKLLHQGLWINMPMRPLCETCAEEANPETQELIASWTKPDEEHPFDKLRELNSDLQ
ncbi:MAG: DUF177 domain-containing protein [Chthonomonas sp.]|nr:DUF177 domain-containing protein [Chthonomonas sp.]